MDVESVVLWQQQKLKVTWKKWPREFSPQRISLLSWWLQTQRVWEWQLFWTTCDVTKGSQINYLYNFWMSLTFLWQPPLRRVWDFLGGGYMATSWIKTQTSISLVFHVWNAAFFWLEFHLISWNRRTGNTVQGSSFLGGCAFIWGTPALS